VPLVHWVARRGSIAGACNRWAMGQIMHAGGPVAANTMSVHAVHRAQCSEGVQGECAVRGVRWPRQGPAGVGMELRWDGREGSAFMHMAWPAGG